MTNPNHHKTTRSSHGMFFKELAPWKDKQGFSDALLYDERTQAVPKSMYRNKVMDTFIKDHVTLNQVPDMGQYLQKLKSQEILRDDHIKFAKTSGANRVTYIYNDYHRKTTNPGFSRNMPSGKFWFH